MQIFPFSSCCCQKNQSFSISGEEKETKKTRECVHLWCTCTCHCFCLAVSRVQLFMAPWSVAHQAPLSMGFSRQECWSGLPFPSPGDLSDPGFEHRSPALQANDLTSEPPGKKCFTQGLLGLQPGRQVQEALKNLCSSWLQNRKSL